MAKKRAANRMSRRTFLELSAVAAAGALTGLPLVRASAPAAELVLLNGKILTIDPQDAIAEGVAVRGGAIIDAGAAQKISGYIGAGTRVVDLQGKTVTPGLIDSHAHLSAFGQRENGWFVKLQGMKEKEEILEALAKRARMLPRGGWVSAWGIEDLGLAYFDKEELDKVSKEHPILAVHTTGQWGFANSLALKISGVTGATQSPPGSKVETTLFGGEPTGALIHYPALQLVRDHMPVPNDRQAREAVLFAAKLYAAEGVTAIHDNFFSLGTPYFHRAYFDLVQAGELPVRLKIWPYFPNLQAASMVCRILFTPAGGPGGRIQDLVRYKQESPALFASLWGGFKLAIDGVALWYDSQMRGAPLHRKEDLQAMVTLFHRTGQQISIHAAGDRAVDMILDAIEASLQEQPRQDHRHRIEHALLPRTDSLDRIKRLGVVVSTHPQWIYSWGDKWKMKNGAAAIPLKRYLQRGIPVALGADPPAFPVYQPQVALWQAVKRTTETGLPLDTAESISIRDALRMQTMGSAYAAFQERELGSLEIGKRADMVVWDRDYYSVPANEIRNAKALMTFVGGRLVHERKEA